ncbi:MAG: EAL domain-containing protein, partial [Lachnospiraceae bacterium]|nr:EAL domain-containing protein [Lachnospiraceae bacterium]
MFQGLVILLILLICIMLVCIRFSNRGDERNRRSVVQLIWTAVITTVCYTGFILVPSGQHRPAVFMAGLYYLSTDWLVVYLLLFAFSYTRLHPLSRLSLRVIGFLAGVDSISFLVNTFTNHMFDLERTTADDLQIQYWDVHLNAPHSVHRLFVYSLVLYSLGIFLYCLVKSPAIYRKKYGTILFQTLMVVGLNILCSILGTKFDYSVVLYASLAISICYFALYASPRRLLERIHSTIVGDSVIGLFTYDNDGRCVGVNRVAKELFSGEPDIYAFAEQYLADWEEAHRDNSSGIVSDDRTLVKDGQKIYLHVTYQKFADKKGRNLGRCLQIENRTEVVNKFEEEQYRASHDALTGLLNRNAFEDRARKILSDAEEPYVMICSNIKDFKLVNELYGSETGDRLLIAQADILHRAADENCISARIFADKFSTLMPKSRFSEQRLLNSMAALRRLNLVSTFKLHYYMGVYEIQDVNEPIWTMYDKAIMAIDTLRGSYGQSLCYYRDELLEHIMKEKEVLGEFDKAIEKKEFHMFLQPQIANNGAIVGAEALVRWIHPKKGMISPGLFIPTLEKAGLIQKLDLYMWENAARKLQEWKEQGREGLSISVNISTKDFRHLDICEAFRLLAEKYNFDVKKLKLE